MCSGQGEEASLAFGLSDFMLWSQAFSASWVVFFSPRWLLNP